MKSSLAKLGLTLDDNTLSLLYIYYTGNNTDTKLTLDGFATIALNMAQDEQYKSYFSEDTIKSLQTIKGLVANAEVEMLNINLYAMFGIDGSTGAKLNYVITLGNVDG